VEWEGVGETLTDLAGEAEKQSWRGHEWPLTIN